MKNKLEQLRKDILENIYKVKSPEVLRKLEIKYLGRKGELTKILRGISALGFNEKKTIGKLANEVKTELREKFKQAREMLIDGTKSDKFVDVTLPGEKVNKGHIHPITEAQNELEDLFISMGFMVLDGPELESDYYNFKALNIPKNHPARDMQDTFYIEGEEGEKSDFVMRTHTSPVQVRAMQKYGVPFRGVVPGRVFRCEEIDACHEHTFYQMEGLMVDKDISISNLIGVMKELLKGVFKKDMDIRIRPGFFPFVEPGIELDIRCAICAGKGCSSCKNSGWLELLPAGMVHPNVLKYGGVDPKKYSGLAFGLGLTRLAMMKYGIEDIRLFNSGDLRFLSQF